MYAFKCLLTNCSAAIALESRNFALNLDDLAGTLQQVLITTKAVTSMNDTLMVLFHSRHVMSLKLKGLLINMLFILE